MCATAALAEAGMLPHKLVKDPERGDAMLMVGVLQFGWCVCVCLWVWVWG